MSELLRIPVRGHDPSKARIWMESLVEWLPLCALPVAAIAFTSELQPWMRMWALAGAIYGGFKWGTWRLALARGAHSSSARSLAYLLLWPGMDARKFLTSPPRASRPAAMQWTWAVVKTGFGLFLLCGVARLPDSGLVAGWMGMVGIIFVLHFGTFELIALFWQRMGINAQPLMRFPACAVSLGDFWGRRWNSAFRSLAFDLLFQPLGRVLDLRMALMVTFIASGLIHDLVISFPASGGYGLPTIYFALQGVGILVERSTFGIGLGLRNSILGRLFTLIVVVAPVGLLFPSPFVERVVVPFMHAIKALP